MSTRLHGELMIVVSWVEQRPCSNRFLSLSTADPKVRDRLLPASPGAMQRLHRAGNFQTKSGHQASANQGCSAG